MTAPCGRGGLNSQRLNCAFVVSIDAAAYGSRARRRRSTPYQLRVELPYPYDPAAWQNFYVMMGSANAALTGLVFVALSIHLKAVLEHPLLRPRAVIALTVLTTQIVIAAIVLTPQTAQWMGAEIFLVNAAFLAVDLRHRVSWTFTRTRLLSLAIRMVY